MDLIIAGQAVDGTERIAELIRKKMAEPAFVELSRNLPQVNWPRYLPVQMVSTQGVTGWKVRLPGGREIGLLAEEWDAAIDIHAAERG